MYFLHIANKNYSSWSLRPWVLMKTLGIPFEDVMHPFPGLDAHAEFKAFSPSALVPLLIDGDVKVWDSLAIAEYLAERHDGVWPADPVARAFARSAAAEMHSGFSTLRSICTMNCGIRVELPEIGPKLGRDIDRFTELWREGLSRFGGPFLAGETFTAADAFFCPVAFRAQTYGLPLDEISAAYAQRLRDLPAMREWYHASLRETWREPGHEDEARSSGEWTADYRAVA
jgi:glutathione S-transferase